LFSFKAIVKLTLVHLSISLTFGYGPTSGC
jgi:hypothetical protein